MPIVRLFVANAVLLGLAVLLAPACEAGPPNPREPRGRVYLIRGQGWVFSSGWAILRDRLRSAGVRAEDVSDLDGAWVGDDVLADHRAGRLSGPIVFVGHSRGGRQSLYAAERLRREGVRIDLILTADVAVPQPVPANVGRAVNLYLSKNRVYPARPLKPAPDSHAFIENVALDAPGSPFAPHGLHHLNFTDSREVRDYLFGRIMQVMRASEEF
jgi:pimeloyl-ACP methyl ester carboxylesterase